MIRAGLVLQGSLGTSFSDDPEGRSEVGKVAPRRNRSGGAFTTIRKPVRSFGMIRVSIPALCQSRVEARPR
jgi:hypothetical protein